MLVPEFHLQKKIHSCFAVLSTFGFLYANCSARILSTDNVYHCICEGVSRHGREQLFEIGFNAVIPGVH